MLLTTPSRHATGHDRETGSALAGVIGILAATGIIAATLLAVAVFGTGFTSASRAAVQAQAAAEGGLDYAVANPGVCDPASATVRSPAGSLPKFDVEVWYRFKLTGPWTRGCAPSDAIQTRLVSRGQAAAIGAAGHTRGNVRTMEAVFGYEFPFLVLGDRLVSLTGSLTVFDTDARPADVSTNDHFSCGGGFTIRGVLYVRGSAYGCTGKTIVSAFDPTVAPHALPRLTPGDRRWPTTPGVLTPGGGCTVSGGTLQLSRRAVQCAGMLKLSTTQITLTGDVVIFAPQVSLDDVNVTSVGGRFSLYFVKPWPAGQTHCAAADAVPDVAVKKLVTDDFTTVMLYSSTEVQLDSPEGTPLRAQLYGCQVETRGSPRLFLAPTGPMALLSKRDVT